MKNQHIDDYLEQYIKRRNSQFSVLLTGDWGIGKTFYIKNFSKNHRDYKFIHISLFGLKDVLSVDEQIFEKVDHTFKQKKVAQKFANEIFNRDFSFVIKFWKNFRHIGKQKTIFVFDDLERTKIDFQEILGYINRLIEHDDFKVILLANEKNILNSKENKSIYKSFKEKVIGKTFNVEQDFDNAIQGFVKSLTIHDKYEKRQYKGKDLLERHIKKLKKVCLNSKINNLRLVKQVILDFCDFVDEYIDDQYLGIRYKEFEESFLYAFFAFSIEYKSGSLNFNSLNFNHLDEEFKKKYMLHIDNSWGIKKYLFTKEVWKEIILFNSYDREGFERELKKLPYFLDKGSTLEKLIYRDFLLIKDKLDEQELETLFQDFETEFINKKYDDLRDFLWAVYLMIDFINLNIINLGKEQVESKCREYVKEFKVKWNNIKPYFYLTIKDFHLDSNLTDLFNQLENEIFNDTDNEFQPDSTIGIEMFLNTLLNVNYRKSNYTIDEFSSVDIKMIPDSLEAKDLLEFFEKKSLREIQIIGNNILELSKGEKLSSDLKFWEEFTEILDGYIHNQPNKFRKELLMNLKLNLETMIKEHQ